MSLVGFELQPRSFLDSSVQRRLSSDNEMGREKKDRGEIGNSSRGEFKALSGGNGHDRQLFRALLLRRAVY